MKIHFDQTCLLWWLFVYFIHSWEALFIILSFYWLKTRFTSTRQQAIGPGSGGSRKKNRENATVKILEFEISRLIRILLYFRSRLWIWKKNKLHLQVYIFIGKPIQSTSTLFSFLCKSNCSWSCQEFWDSSVRNYGFERQIQNSFKQLLCLETVIEVAERKSEISGKKKEEKKGCLDKNRILMPSCV